MYVYINLKAYKKIRKATDRSIYNVSWWLKLSNITGSLYWCILPCS